MPAQVKNLVAVEFVSGRMSAVIDFSCGTGHMIGQRLINRVTRHAANRMLYPPGFDVRQHLMSAIAVEAEVVNLAARLKAHLIRHRFVIPQSFTVSERTAKEQNR